MLEGLRVLDVSTVLAGPSVGTFLAELGADVLKIEHPSHPDVTRGWKLPQENPDSPVSAYFSSINYLKKYKLLNLSQTEDRLEFLDLIMDTDILISNFKKGDDVKFHLEDNFLLTLNPRLIIGKINGYGADSDRVAYDLILQAESGFMSMNGTSESGPVKMPVALIDVLAAHHLKEGILLALYEREKTGKGKSLSVSLYDAALSSMVNQASNYLMTGHIPQRIGSLHPNIAPYGEIFTTQDQLLITFAIGSDTHFKKLCSELGLNELISDARFSSNQSRVTHRNELKELLQHKISERKTEELLQNLHKLNVPCGQIKDIQEVFESPEARRLIREETIHNEPTRRITSIAFRENDN